MTNHGRSSPEALLLVVLLLFGFRLVFSFIFGYGLSFCSINFRKERLGYGWSRYLAQQQSPSCDLASINRVPGIIVLTNRCTFQREPRERTLGTGVGQNLC